jgi:protein-S-isoprenylcysteine O-methyltransferase Ste14
MKWFDLPPLWTLLFCLTAYGLGRWDPWALSLAHPVTEMLAGVLIGGGVLLMVLAAAEMRRQRTTIIPHREADRLVQSGIFRRSRNPIYLGDVLILAGVVLWMDAVPGLVLVPVLAWVLERRFIIPEEDRLRRKFRADFARYCEKTRRWL